MCRQFTIPAIVAVCLLTGCDSYHLDPDLDDGDVEISSEAFDEEFDALVGIERWGCGDRVAGCKFGECPVKLAGVLKTNRGAVEAAGTVNFTLFRIVGLQRRWDWGDDGSDGYLYAIVMFTDGSARYYDFSSVMADSDGVHRSKPSDLFKCHRLRK